MRAGGVNEEVIARKVVDRRNVQKIEARALMTADEVRHLEAGNRSYMEIMLVQHRTSCTRNMAIGRLLHKKSMRNDPEINILLGFRNNK